MSLIYINNGGLGPLGPSGVQGQSPWPCSLIATILPGVLPLLHFIKLWEAKDFCLLVRMFHKGDKSFLVLFFKKEHPSTNLA